MDKVIIIGCGVSGYAVIRALAGRKIKTIALTYARRDFAHLSRYVSEVVHIPVPEQDEQKFIGVLLENASRWEGALILETSDNTSIALSRHIEPLSKHYRIVTPAWETLRLFVEKENTYALAKQCGVPFPATAWLAKPEDLPQASHVQYPCILKPVRSFEFISRFQVKNFEVHNQAELMEKLKLCMEAGIAVIAQEVIPGPDDQLFKLHGYINSQGQIAGKFFYQKLRQNPAHFGVMRVGVSTPTNPEVEQLSERLLMQADYRGYFNTEFKRDPRDGQLKLIEVNCRMPRGGMLPAACGVNYPWMIYLDLVQGKQIDPQGYRQGLYWIELLADISRVMFHKDYRGIPMGDYARPYLARRKVFADLDLRDLKPFMQLIRQKLAGVPQKLRGGLRRHPSRLAPQVK